MMTKKITMRVNGREVVVEVDIRESLLEVLRGRLNLKGVKKGCSVGECGACTVLINGEPIDSCIYLAVWTDGKEIRTIEGEETGVSCLNRSRPLYLAELSSAVFVPRLYNVGQSSFG